jgi:dTDP-4-amino-4,6-dideoxygalactose transaminase
MMNVPLVDLKTQHEKLWPELMEALKRCTVEDSFIGGPDHTAFASEFAKFCGGGEVILCANGTDALYLTYREALGEGDRTGEVIVPTHTFIATSEAVSQAGYRPVFVDIDPRTYTIDPAGIEKAITSKTRAIVPVHIYGQMANMEAIQSIAKKHSLFVLEDCAQAHGATWKGKNASQWGDAATFSFYPGKNLGALGDAGAMLTRDADLAARLRKRANHGRLSRYEHEFEGVNSRLDGLQAAFLRIKLRHLAQWNQQRRVVATWYAELLSGLQDRITLPITAPEATHVFHLYVIQVDNRDQVLAKLQQKGVMAGIHYPIPLHRQPAYSTYGYAKGSMPVAETISQRILSLPISPDITRDQVEYVCKTLNTALES